MVCVAFEVMLGLRPAESKSPPAGFTHSSEPEEKWNEDLGFTDFVLQNLLKDQRLEGELRNWRL